MFKIKTRYYLEHLTLEIMKLLGSPKSNITKDNNGENVPYLEITGVVLLHCYVVNNSYQKIQESCIHLFLISCSVNYQIFHAKTLYFQKRLIHNFCILKYSLQIKIIIFRNRRQNKYHFNFSY